MNRPRGGPLHLCAGEPLQWHGLHVTRRWRATAFDGTPGAHDPAVDPLT